MRAIIPDIRRHGAELVIVGNGQPWQAAAFREELELLPPDHDVPILVDPALTAYRAAGLRRGITSTFSPRAAGNLVRALRAGHRQKGVQGDAWQLGGVFVVHRDATVPWSYVSRAAGDHPPPADILAALA